MSDVHTLFCLLEDEHDIFEVQANVTDYIPHLRVLIKDQKRNALKYVDANDLLLYKVISLSHLLSLLNFLSAGTTGTC